MDRSEKWAKDHRVKEEVWKREQGKEKGGVLEFKQCGNCLPSQKTGSREECKRNLKRWEWEKRNLLRTPKPPECPLKNFASLRRLTLHCTCFLLCRFVVVIAISSQMLLFIQRGLVKMSLFYHDTMFHCDTLPRRGNVAMCEHELGMPMNASIWDIFKRHIVLDVYLLPQQT